MPIAVIYDLSRLITRVANATPNGIDRVDWLLARHVLSHSRFRTSAIGLGFTGPRLLSKEIAREAAVARAWSETSAGNGRSRAYEELVARLGASGNAASGRARIVEPRALRLADVARAFLHYAPSLGAPPRTGAPKHAFYLNAANFPLDWRRHVAWLDQRLDMHAGRSNRARIICCC
jgi:hypothetical protein